MAKPFKETVNIQPQTFSTGAAQNMMSLADKLNDFSSFTAQKVAEKQIQEATIKGQEAGITQQQAGTPMELKEETFIGGVSKRAYNTALREGYIKSLDNDNIAEIGRIASENSTNLIGFNEAVNTYAKGVMDNVDPSAKSSVALSIDSMVARYRPKIQSAQMKQAEKDANDAQATNTFERGRLAQSSAFEGDAENAAINLAAAIDSVSNRTDLSGEDKAKLINELQREEREAFMSGEISRVYQEQGKEAAFKAVDSMKMPKGFTPDEWDSFVGSALADINQQVTIDAEAAASEQIDISRQVSNLQIQARTGTGKPSEIIAETEKLFNEGKLSKKERTSIITNLMNGQKTRRKEAVDDAAVANKIAGEDGIVLDDKQINSYYDRNVAPNLEDLPEGARNAAQAQFVERVKQVPTAMKNQIINDLRSDNAELIANAADMIDRLDSIPGLVDRDFSANDRAYGRLVADLSQNLAPPEAVKLAQEQTNPNNKARVEARQAQLKELVNKDPKIYTNAIDSEFSPFFGTDLLDRSNAPALNKEFQSLFDAHYVAGMDESNAKQKALQIMERNWKAFDGKLIKYSPADYYSVGGDTDYIKDQLYSDVMNSQILPFGFTKEDLIIVGNTPRTARLAAKGQPEYLIGVNGGDQGVMFLNGFYWKPDVGAEIERREGLSEVQVRQMRANKDQSDFGGKVPFKGF